MTLEEAFVEGYLLAKMEGMAVVLSFLTLAEQNRMTINLRKVARDYWKARV